MARRAPKEDDVEIAVQEEALDTVCPDQWVYVQPNVEKIALYHALIDIGLTTFVPRFGHLPYVMGEGNKKLSKRDPEAHALAYREQGFLPEGLLNYLALLGWSPGGDQELFTRDELVAKFRRARRRPSAKRPKPRSGWKRPRHPYGRRAEPASPSRPTAGP